MNEDAFSDSVSGPAPPLARPSPAKGVLPCWGEVKLKQRGGPRGEQPGAAGLVGQGGGGKRCPWSGRGIRQMNFFTVFEKDKSGT